MIPITYAANPNLQAVKKALAAVRGTEFKSLMLSRIVAYALGDGDTTSRSVFERFGPSMTDPGDKKQKSGWLPTVCYAERLEGASAALPKPKTKDAPASERWAIMSGVRPDGRAFAKAWKEGADAVTINVTKAHNEVHARLDAALQAQIWELERRAAAQEATCAA
ncbi:hypothetical protein ACW7BJ_27915 [Azospirillum argentinense]